jgi:hypothetical protein
MLEATKKKKPYNGFFLFPASRSIVQNETFVKALRPSDKEPEKLLFSV